ncbi:MAG: hypothetical protein LBD25_05425 [Coriobacteriales bacterium]|nr:hypothetical protein [Coriobacteriales bacterium]
MSKRKRQSAQAGQMTVELALAIPTILAVVGIIVNLMVYLGVCARFDRLTAEAVRIEATSPGYGSYGTASRERQVYELLQEQFADEQDFVTLEVTARQVAADGVGGGSGGGVMLSLVPAPDAYVCVLRYTPWGLPKSVFGIEVAPLAHERVFVVDPFRPGVLV